VSRRAPHPVPDGTARFFDPVAAPWFFPLLVLSVLVLVRIQVPGFAEKPELFSLDLALKVRAMTGRAGALDPEIRFVELSMDEEWAKRLATVGEYATVAGLLKTLASLEASVIAVDIIHSYGRIEDQQVLAAAIREIQETTDARIVLASSIEGTDDKHLLRPLQRAGGEAFAQGIVNVPADRHWREYQLVYRFKGETLPSFALAAFGASRPAALAPKAVSEGVMEWKGLGPDGKSATFRGDESRLFLNLPHSYFDDRYDDRHDPKILGRKWSVEEVERAAANTGEASPLAGSIVFLGFDEETDGKPTTHGAMEPGMFLHATALHDLKHGTAIRPAPPALDLSILFATALLAACAFSLARRKRWLILVSLVSITAILAAGWASIWYFHLLPASISAAALWGFAVFLEVGRRWTLEARERTRRDAMLGFYFSPAVLKQVMQDLDMIRPRGGEVAVLLSDLRGFTTLCESGEVERVFELLNRLFAIETDAALREDGSLARFAGDQFLAYWGAPEPCDDAADRALRAAVEIQDALRSRREAPAADELDSRLHIGIGLHCGPALVGHVGSRSYRDYNIVGDTVNTTSRIESLTKHYAAAVLASGEFVAALRTKPVTLLLDRVQLKGRSRGTGLHAVFSAADDPGAAARESWSRAFALYEGSDFAEAAAAFKTLTNHPHATLATSAKLLGSRCAAFAKKPPADWDGVFELTSK
jgi:class 3 adenylate cyclase/CHASE2 domain-containing sensor protein